MSSSSNMHACTTSKGKSAKQHVSFTDNLTSSSVVEPKRRISKNMEHYVKMMKEQSLRHLKYMGEVPSKNTEHCELETAALDLIVLSEGPPKQVDPLREMHEMAEEMKKNDICVRKAFGGFLIIP